jgi:hypothetical protein
MGRNIKTLALGLTVAAILTALTGASTASATELCSTATTPCSETMYEPGQELHMALKPETGFVIATNFDTWACGESTLGGQPTSTGSSGTTAVKVEITEFTLVECEDSFGSRCTLSSEFLPANGEFIGGSASQTGAFNVKVTSKLGAHMECGLLINCNIFIEATVLPGKNRSSGTPLVEWKNVTMKKTGGFCPETVTANATYEITEPDPSFVV